MLRVIELFDKIEGPFTDRKRSLLFPTLHPCGYHDTEGVRHTRENDMPTHRAPMNKQHEKSDVDLEAVHVCRGCGAEYQYSEVPENVTITGIVECTMCGYAGILNVEIRPKARSQMP